MKICQPCRSPASGRPVEKALLNQKGFIYIFNGAAFLANGCGQGVKTDRTPAEFVYYRQHDQAIHVIESSLIHFKKFQGFLYDRSGNDSICLDLGKVADATQQAVRYPGCSPAAAGQFPRSFLFYLDAEDAGGAGDNGGEFLIGVKLQPGNDAEAISKGGRKEAGTGGCSHQSESGKIQFTVRALGPWPMMISS